MKTASAAVVVDTTVMTIRTGAQWAAAALVAACTGVVFADFASTKST
jgi:hypothetical protein